MIYRILGYLFFWVSIAYSQDYVEILKKNKPVREECNSLKMLEGFKPSQETSLGRYGGWTKKKYRATGFFHTSYIKDHWWIIDPEGYAFISMGINSVNSSIAGPDSPPTPGNRAWGEKVVGDLKAQGFNTAGSWSAARVISALDQPMPYCLRWNVFTSYRNERKKKYPSTEEPMVISPFDPEFGEFCNRHLAKAKATSQDPWLLGHFSDNELSLQEKGIVQRYLNHPPDDPNHIAAHKFMNAQGRKKPTREDNHQFLKLVVETHYRKIHDALEAHDPNHMFLGTRFHGRGLDSPAIFEAAGKYADIISVNYYHRWTPEQDRITQWSELANKPILITEWYAMAEDSGLPVNQFGAGFAVKTQKDRAKFYEHFTLGLLKNKSCVGWHWFKYQDGRNNAGVIDEQGQPHKALWDKMKNLNTQAYPLKEFFEIQQ